METLKDFCKDFYHIMLQDWPFGTILGIVIIIVLLVLIVYLLSLVKDFIVSAINSWFLPNKKGVGIVVDKEITPKIDLVRFTIPSFNLLTIEIGERTGETSVTEEFFNSLKKGSKVKIIYTECRIYNGSINIKEIHEA
jgi:hypothetical protein